MPKPGNQIHIPLPEHDAIAGLLRVKPTASMPRPGAAQTAKGKRKKNSKAKPTK